MNIVSFQPNFSSSSRSHRMAIVLAIAAICAFVLAMPQVAHAQSPAYAAQAPGLTRAQVRQDLINLEAAGYNPGQNDMYYPNNLQAAERRASTQEWVH